MLVFFAKRLASSILLLFVVTTATFFLVFAGGPDIARRLLGQYATETQVQAKAAELGLDQPLFDQYLNWLLPALRGDLGTSWFTSEPVTQALANRLTVTFSIVLIVVALSALLSITLGMAAAVRRGWIDRLVQILAISAYALPGFIVAIVLVTVFAVQLRWFPATGFVPLAQDPAMWAWSLVLPVTALLFATVASAAQQMRSSFIEALRRDHIRTLRSRGIGEAEILWKHVLRAAAPPGLTVLSLQFIGLLGGTVIVEQVFALPGLGYLAVQSTSRGDLPVILGVVIVTVSMVILVNLLIDLVIAWLNPKVRLA